MATWQEMEQSVRDYLTRCFNQPFSKRVLKIEFGGATQHEFDAVSEDGKIVAEAKHILGGQSAQLNSISGDLMRLHSLEGRERKFMFITDPLTYWLYCRANRGILMEIRRLHTVELVPPMEFLDI